ncbi:hypothetical protein EXIGLDRAFT_618083 [Exidia glandulosa HHB12029]|uniref:AB hydrolase-1 domain-containing protein n=1 Tax=Exidia glandulosa HHB12029 TaxID=1314781 RepID=A0A165FUN5_EXIGL|nr:hypothetical protein EXIGLDRAFT_618083 [Exidia glandulosa HHB12029]
MFSLLFVALVALTGRVLALSFSCSEFTSKIDAQATNVAHITLNFTGSGTVRVAGSWDIAFRFCQPLLTKLDTSSTLQVLGSGATYTKEYWHLSYKPEDYDYQRHAAVAGYSTLAFDLLGAGASAKPDPFCVVQIPMNVAIATEIVKRVRGGTLTKALPAFSKIVYVGHSMGSVILNGIMVGSPSLIDAAVLTGYAHPSTDMPVHVPTVADGDIQIAATTFPRRFGSLDPGYTVIENRALFYGPNGTFDPKVFELDVATQDLVSVGDADTLNVGERLAADFTGPILSVEGDLDAGNCTPNCSNIPEEAAFYPRAASFDYVIIPNTGHVLNLHLTAPKTFAIILEWIKSQGF